MKSVARKKSHRPIQRLFPWLLIAIAAAAFPLLADQGDLKSGVKAYQDGNYEEALGKFQNALLDDPENPQIHFDAGTALYQQEKYEDALKSFQKAIQTNEETLQEAAYYNQGNTLFRMDKLQEAIEAYKKALDLNPDDQDAKFNLEFTRAKLKEMSEKQKTPDQQQQEKIEPSEYAKQLKAQAEILVQQRLYKQALQLMQQGLQSDPTVQAFQAFITRLQNVVEIEEGAI